ncbi:glycosyltransferase [Nanoarchaeota archaeon]
MFLLSFFENKNNLRNPKPKILPSVSVIIPAFNEEKSIAKTIRSLLNLDYPKDKLNIIVVDDGSIDNTLKIAKSFENKGVRVFHKENGGKGSALNFGLTKIKTEFVASMDADSFVTRSALKRMIGYFHKKEVMAVAPSIKIWKPTNFLGKVQLIEFLSATFIRKIFSILGGVPIVPGPFSIFRKEFFDKYGGYDTSTLTEDIEISLRIESKKFLIENALDANVYTTAVTTFKQMFHQRLRWFRGFIDNIYRYRFLLSPKYGNMGVFILPVSIISVSLGVIAFIYSVIMLIINSIQNLYNLYLIGFDISTWFEFEFDAFFLNTTATGLLPLVLIIISITMIYLAKKHSKEPQPVKLPYVFFIMTYWFISAICWISAAACKIRGKSVTWGKRAL